VSAAQLKRNYPRITAHVSRRAARHAEGYYESSEYDAYQHIKSATAKKDNEGRLRLRSFWLLPRQDRHCIVGASRDCRTS
jgi:hypothetical protein